MTPLGMYVQRCRKQRGWTMMDLSRQSNVPYGTIRNIEQNPRPVKPHEETLRGLASAFGSDTLDILFALAGYGIPISETEAERNHVIDALLAARPDWRHVLHDVQARPPEEQDQALQVLRVFLKMQGASS